MTMHPTAASVVEPGDPFWGTALLARLKANGLNVPDNIRKMVITIEDGCFIEVEYETHPNGDAVVETFKGTLLMETAP